ncbi:hypothetical protein [Paenibacillus tarimensis]|uniref:hypothetical protein n=1 Tax=Paenibacillus tarimensis TaxID=416012 RepID=UPI001F38F313|nr:hypothetical protein [Paenibacillus tarimensis]MCF2943883.1 hypothetical protein [Paenibacillus tarimensis]
MNDMVCGYLSCKKNTMVLMLRIIEAVKAGAIHPHDIRESELALSCSDGMPEFMKDKPSGFVCDFN